MTKARELLPGFAAWNQQDEFHMSRASLGSFESGYPCSNKMYTVHLFMLL